MERPRYILWNFVSQFSKGGASQMPILIAGMTAYAVLVLAIVKLF